eukprot:Anaeramoba_flamelloidesa329807_9.p1 GENE.a329807_9~~a329807_9.p1  ORF type:complete len:112 (+),score=7.31 a329807_9:132-467(+)
MWGKHPQQISQHIYNTNNSYDIFEIDCTSISDNLSFLDNYSGQCVVYFNHFNGQITPRNLSKLLHVTGYPLPNPFICADHTYVGTVQQQHNQQLLLKIHLDIEQGKLRIQQ